MFKHTKKRASTYKNIFPSLNTLSSISKDLVNINCKFTFTFIVYHWFSNFPSVTETITCSGCTKIQRRTKITVSIRLSTESLEFLLDRINAEFSNISNPCDSCSIGLLSSHYKLQNHIFIAIVNIFDTNIKNTDMDVSTMLNNIIKMIAIEK